MGSRITVLRPADNSVLDWNAYAACAALIKLFHEEEDTAVYALLDASASMGFGRPTKLDFGVRAARRSVTWASAAAMSCSSTPVGRRTSALAAVPGRGCAMEMFDCSGLRRAVRRKLPEAVTRFCAHSPRRAGLRTPTSEEQWQEPSRARSPEVRRLLCRSFARGKAASWRRPAARGRRTGAEREITMGQRTMRDYGARG